MVCIDEFQQIGEFPNSLNVQKRLRSVWQHQQHVSYCLFGSKKHLMTNLFQNRKMPFYQFGEMLYLEAISTEDWIPFLQSRFKSKGKLLPENLARKICETVENHSSYVQQLAWNVLVETTEEATEENFNNGVQALLAQCSGLFEQQIQGLSSHQMNFLRAISNGIHKEFASVKVSKGHIQTTQRELSAAKDCPLLPRLQRSGLAAGLYALIDAGGRSGSIQYP